MESTIWISWCLVAIAACYIFYAQKKKQNLPPGPFSWPLVGSFFSVGLSRHHSFAKLAEKYGPVMYLKLGSRPHLIISSSGLAKEALKDHDVEFASRPQFSTLFKHVSHNFNDLVFAPYGDHWKFLRRICGMELFTTSKVGLFSGIRKRELEAFGEAITAESQKPIDMSVKFHELFTNFMGGVLFGMKFYRSDVEVTPEAACYRARWDTLVAETQRIYIGDFIPALRWIDKLKNSEHRLKHEVLPAVVNFLKAVVEDHKKSFRPDQHPRDFVDVMLSLNGEDKLADASVIALLQNMLLAGTLTSRGSLEWAFSELVRNPQVMKKAQQELDSVVGKDRFLEEADLKNLTYIHCLVKEVLRLHPVAPMGIPKCNLEATSIAGYTIPKNTTLLVNLWAIARDPSVWKNPESFDPERFMGSDVNVLGAHFDLIPFSSGRRRCVGIPLAMPHITLTLAYLLHRFDWAAAEEPLDMSETTGQVCLRAKKLVLVASPRMLT